MLDLLWTIIIGFIAGLIARAVHPGDDKAGFIVTTLLGIIGALVATYAGRFMGLYQEHESGGFIAAVIGAVIVLIIYNFIRKRTA